MKKTKEIWKEVDGYDGVYWISNIGRLKSIGRMVDGHGDSKYWRPGIIRKPVKDNLGYFGVVLRKKAIGKTMRIHRMVAKAFIPNPDNKPFVNHINGIKKDNRVENLEWCSASENVRHAHCNGLMKQAKGEKAWKAKLTEKDVLYIRSIKGKTQKEIAIMYGMDNSTISEIINRKLWKHI